MPIDNKFNSTLVAQDIIVRQDEGEGKSAPSENIGKVYPLVRIGDRTIDNNDLVSFTLDIGTDTLPTLFLSINDSDENFRKNSITDDYVFNDGILTLYIGNINDDSHNSIKADFRITEVISSEGSENIGVEAVLYVPEMTRRLQIAYQGTSLDVLEQIAIDCGLGFNTNLDISQDESIWMSGMNRFELVKHIEKHSYISDSETIKVYVDQWLNLNVIGLSAAIDDTFEYLIDVDVEGNPITPVPLLVTDDPDPDNDFGLPLNGWSSKIDITQYMGNYQVGNYSEHTDDRYIDFETEETVIEGLLAEQTEANYYGGRYDFDSLHEKYGTSPERNRQLKRTILQGTTLDFKIENYVGFIFTSMICNFEMYSTDEDRSELVLNQEDKTSTSYDLTEENSENKPEISRIEEVSGGYFIMDMQIRYITNERMFLTGTGLKQV